MGGQGPVKLVGAQSFQNSDQQIGDAVSSLFSKTTDQLSGAVSSPIAGPLAAWMPPPSPHGRVNGVSRKR
ncbi:hypothetical protein DZD52_06630 [Xanthomonas nasturtii]|uniref:Uncharacterized protein n=1 Tax=Xanthomonas nasturtii TaxID=1843581 RepID=A0A3E1KNC5_9XANT|nr:hypothetical protein DZD52_06630 [Xanthomonas nasturtii]